VDGYIFDSRKEAARYQELKMLEMAGEIKNVECQFKFEVKVEGKHVCNYFADFAYLDKNDVPVFEDVKGYKTDVYKLKKKLVEAIYKIKIEEV
jgi:hypothetical protein